MFVVLLGPPGAGKGTQAERLAGSLMLVHLSTGALLREAVQQVTALGRLAKVSLDRGELVADEIVSRLVAERLGVPDARRGVIFDGYPRTLAQAKDLDRALGRHDEHLTAAINLTVAIEALVGRMTSRRVCARCGSTYNTITQPPLQAEVCDRCGEALVCRSDDRPSVIRRRLEIYQAQAAPLEDYYRQRGLLIEISADRPPDLVTTAMLTTVERLAAAQVSSRERIRAIG
jgi:adenylate kinase